jgi:hypothetical protein
MKPNSRKNTASDKLFLNIIRLPILCAGKPNSGAQPKCEIAVEKEVTKLDSARMAYVPEDTVK